MFARAIFAVALLIAAVFIFSQSQIAPSSTVFLQWGVLVVDFVKSVAWPLAIVWGAWFFRSDLTNLAERIIEVGPAKAVLAPPAAAAKQQKDQIADARVNGAVGLGPAENSATDPAGVSDAVSRVRALHPAELLDERIAQFKSIANHAGMISEAEKLNYAEHVAASLSINLQYEQAYRIIFGSQLALILAANSSGGASLSKAQEIFDAASKSYPAVYSDMKFEEWINYPIGTKLLSMDQSGRYVATILGAGLLRYILDMKLPSEKMF